MDRHRYMITDTLIQKHTNTDTKITTNMDIDAFTTTNIATCTNTRKWSVYGAFNNSIPVASQ